MEKTLLAGHPVRELLITEIYVSNWMYFDGWSFVHFFSGFSVGFILSRYLKGLTLYVAAFLILAVYEVWENMTSQMIFAKEPALDIIWDLIVGMVAVFVGQWAMKKYKQRKSA